MAGSNKSKKRKIVKQNYSPDIEKKPYSKRVESTSKYPTNIQNPDEYYHSYPSWNFKIADNECWAFNKTHTGDRIWDEIIPHFQSFETQTWGEILVKGKKQNHSINVDELNKDARNRLTTLNIEEESVISLRLSSKHRVYGLIYNSIFNILWYDNDHGDHDTCVCRSNKKHT